MIRRSTFIIYLQVTPIAFWMGKFLHEGLESRVDRVSDSLFGGRFDPKLLSFQVCFDLIDRGRGGFGAFCKSGRFNCFSLSIGTSGRKGLRKSR